MINIFNFFMALASPTVFRASFTVNLNSEAFRYLIKVPF